MAEIKLGLGNPPQPIYMYVKKLEVDGRIYAWYNCEIEQDKKIPVSQRALTGYILELRLTDKDFKGKDNLKLDIVVQADEIYIVRSGIETNFAKSFLLAASVVKDFTQPIIIVATPGDENSVFCNLYNALTKTKIRREWNPNADWAIMIRDVQSKLTPSSDSVDYVPSIAQPQATSKQTGVTSSLHPQDLRVKQIRTLLNYPLDLIKEWLRFQDASSPSELHHSKVDELVKTMCIAWASDKFDHPNHAANSYQKHVVNVVADGVDEVQAIKEWMQQVQKQTFAQMV
ncbi:MULTISPECIES: hypothetical protein [unclassified Tolypothrix]|uniref:hypothetical protein n=1 Tax=unclassified Tolypothrix TaxID=2649714 RepID=UPI0005EAC05E|nr:MULTISPECIES: hypothetical protein [unclassified Tolypothrix]EKE98260.1 hypothetical protein FDUTEX481_04154 [Tolypothrix sp. PCC 7601]BAY95266.1 hypothetical protein NIES3275_73230 [Microchaete diplosiphon NIES-3275]